MVDGLFIGKPEEETRTSSHSVCVKVSLQLVGSWRMLSHDESQAGTNLQKVMFEYGKRYVEDILKSKGELDETIEMGLLATYNTEMPCPFNPSRIVDPNGARVEVDIPSKDAQAPNLAMNSDIFISPQRLAELRSLPKTKFELTRLIELCEELNRCYQSECYLAVAALSRALIDYVPPIFGYTTFNEVANNYPGASSFKKQMKHLQESCRNIADLHLHTQAKLKESLPTKIQVNFAADVDSLLGEISTQLK
jgi:hypothetical protein